MPQRIRSPWHRGRGVFLSRADGLHELRHQRREWLHRQRALVKRKAVSEFFRGDEGRGCHAALVPEEDAKGKIDADERVLLHQARPDDGIPEDHDDLIVQLKSGIPRPLGMVDHGEERDATLDELATQALEDVADRSRALLRDQPVDHGHFVSRVETGFPISTMYVESMRPVSGPRSVALWGTPGGMRKPSPALRI